MKEMKETRTIKPNGHMLFCPICLWWIESTILIVRRGDCKFSTVWLWGRSWNIWHQWVDVNHVANHIVIYNPISQTSCRSTAIYPRCPTLSARRFFWNFRGLCPTLENQFLQIAPSQRLQPSFNTRQRIHTLQRVRYDRERVVSISFRK